MQETQETQVQSLSQEDPLEDEMASHSSVLAWKTPWTEEPGRLQPLGSQSVGHDWVTEHTEMMGVSMLMAHWVIFIKSHWINHRLPFGSDDKEAASNVWDPGSILDQEDPLEKGMTTHPRILAWRIPWTEALGRLLVHGIAKSQTWLTSYFHSAPLN